MHKASKIIFPTFWDRRNVAPHKPVHLLVQGWEDETLTFQHTKKEIDPFLVANQRLLKTRSRIQFHRPLQHCRRRILHVNQPAMPCTSRDTFLCGGLGSPPPPLPSPQMQQPVPNAANLQKRSRPSDPPSKIERRRGFTGFSAHVISKNRKVKA